MPNSTLPRYQPSGFFRPLTFALFLGATVAGAVMAWGYQLLMDWMPLIYLSMLVCAGYGFVLGWAGAWAVKTGHCRNRMIALLLAVPLLGGAVAATYYWEYQRFLSAVREEQPDLVDQATFSIFLQARRDRGWQITNHGSGGTPIKGDLVWGLWAIEALIIGGVGGFMIWKSVGFPYCERCNLWGSEKKMLLRGLRRGDADTHLSSGDLDAVIELPVPPDPNLSTALALTATLCPSCKETAFLTVEEKTVTTKKRGKKPQEKTVQLVVHAVLRADQREKFLARLEPAPAPSLPAKI